MLLLHGAAAAWCYCRRVLLPHGAGAGGAAGAAAAAVAAATAVAAAAIFLIYEIEAAVDAAAAIFG